MIPFMEMSQTSKSNQWGEQGKSGDLQGKGE